MKIFSFKSKPSILFITSFGCVFLLLSAVFIRSITDKKASPVPKSAMQPKESKENSSVMELNDAIITRLVIENLPEDIPFSNLVVHISEDSEIKIDCSMQRDALTEFINNKTNNIPAYVKLMTNLLPDSVPLSLNLRLAVDSKQGHLILTPQSIIVNNIELTTTMFPTELEVSINHAINSLISNKGKKIESITISDGNIRVNLTEK